MIDVRLLGPVEVEVDGHPLTVDTRKAIALLAYVAVLRRPVSRETLTAMLWPDSSDHDARGSLRRTLSVLRSGLGSVGLLVSRSTVEVDPGSVDVDLDRFRAFVNAARSHAHTGVRGCDACRATLEGAVKIARGPFMEGFSLRDSDTFDEWQSAEREVYQRELAGVLERLVGEQLAASAWDGAIVSGQRWLALDPLHEPAHRALMEAYARSGETAAAVRQYRDAVAILDRELGVVPLPETSELNEAILAGSLTGERAVALAPSVDHRRGPAAPPPLIGRAAELERLQTALAAAAPHGRLVVVEGEAGVGKSRLLDRFVELSAGDGHEVTEARCYAGEAGIAFAPIVALLRARLTSTAAPATLADLSMATRAALSALLPEIETTPASATEPLSQSRPAARLALLDAVADGLTAGADRSRALVVRLDDIQWADESSLESLAFLGRRLRDRPVLLALSWRREELPDHAATIVAEARPPAGDIVRLSRLDPAAIRVLIDALAERHASPVDASTSEDLIAESEGLPLYVVEALASVDREPGAAPAGVRALMQARLAGLSEVATQVAAAASVLGRSFDLDIVRAVSGRSDDETVAGLEELVQRGIVREGANDGLTAYDFAHARLREVAYEETSSARRRLLHRRAADAYRGPNASDRDRLGRLVRIARHERDAGRSAESALAFRDAGELARQVYANREALAHFEAALALGHPDAGRLHEEIGDVLTSLGEYARATAALEAATAGASPDRLAAIEHRLGRVALRRGDPATAEAHLAAATATLETTDTAPGFMLARIISDRASAAARAGDLDRAWRLAIKARDLAHGDRATEVEADRIVGLVARDRGDLEAARLSLEQSRAGAEELADPITSIAASNALSLLAREEGQIEQAIALAVDALATARRTGERHLEAALESNLADALEEAGRHEEAMVHIKASATLLAALGSVSGEPEPGIWMLHTW